MRNFQISAILRSPMKKQWNLQDIKPVGRPRQTTAPAGATPPVTNKNPRLQPKSVTSGGAKRPRGFVTVLVGLLVVGGAITSAVYLTQGADVTVYPKHRSPNVNATFTAFAEPTNREQLGYEVMTLVAEGERPVTATGQQPVSEHATGTITIYKSTPGSQRLITNTRFEDGNGLIFRLVDSVVVPGAKGSEPGSLTADVFASEPGEQYNLNANTRFTIPGLASDKNLFNAMHAENKLALAGGFEGQRFIINDEELTVAQKDVRSELRQALLERLPTERPANLVVFEPAVTFTYESLPAVADDGNVAIIKERASLQVPLFDTEELASFLASATVSGYEGEPVKIDDYSGLTFAYADATTTTTRLIEQPSISFTLTGRPRIVWTYDENKFLTDIRGVNRTALSQVLQAYQPALARAHAEIRPFWRSRFPTDAKHITIKESLETSDD